MLNKKRKFGNLPTIFEVDCEDLEATGPPPTAMPAEMQSQSLPRGLSELLTEPLDLATSAPWAEAIETRLKEASKGDRRILLSWLCPALPFLALSEVGHSVVQVACRLATGTERHALIGRFHGSVADLCASPHGHQVLTTLIETMPVSSLDFVTHELAGQAGGVARHKCGYRVLEALSMHCSAEQMTCLANEIVLETVELSKHKYGNFVVQHLLEYGTQACRADMIRQMLPEIPRLSMERTANRVVQRALCHSSLQEQSLIAIAVAQAATPISLVDIACSRRGSAVLAELANIDVCAADVRLRLSVALPRLSQSKFGRRVAAHFCLMSAASV